MRAAARNCAAAPFDDIGHGTHVAGLIGSSGALSGNLYQGVAPRVSLVGVKVLTSKGIGNTSDVIAAIEHVAVNRARLGVRIINLSLGHAVTMPALLDPLVRVVQYASSLGITVVVAAGNNPAGSENKYGGITSPANAPSALTVGAVSMGNPRPTVTGPTTSSLISALADRRSSTAWRSPISSRPASS